jgi:hypothetical protein
MATTGLVLGAIALLASGAILAAGASFFNSETGKELTNCLKEANNDQAAIDRCEQQFNNKVNN